MLHGRSIQRSLAALSDTGNGVAFCFATIDTSVLWWKRWEEVRASGLFLFVFVSVAMGVIMSLSPHSTLYKNIPFSLLSP